MADRTIVRVSRQVKSHSNHIWVMHIQANVYAAVLNWKGEQMLKQTGTIQQDRACPALDTLYRRIGN